MTTGRLSCIVPCWNTPDFLGLCLHALSLFTSDAELIVVDRSDEGATGCQETAARYGAHYLDLRQPPPNTAELYARLNNIGADAATGDWLAFISDDVIVTPRWIEQVWEDAAQVRHPGLIGCRSNRASGAQQFGVLPPDTVGLTWRIVTVAAAVRREAFDRVGGFDADFPAGSYADDDLSFRLAEAGYRNAVSRAYVHHFGSQACQRNGRDLSKDMVIGAVHMAAKHGNWQERAREIMRSWA